MAIETLAGVYPPLPTPFDDNGDLDTGALRDNLARLGTTGLRGFVILGSNGEYVYLEEEEKLAALQAAREAIPQDLLLIAGTGAESTRATIRLTRKAAELGADAAIIVTPNYYKSGMTGDAMTSHYYTVAEASTIPVIIYNVPQFTGVDLDALTLLKLAEHPNIIGMKESAPNLVKIADVARGAAWGNRHFEVLAGSASYLLSGMSVGAVGGVVASANVAPHECVQVYRDCSTGNYGAALPVQQHLLPLNAAVTTKWGIAGLKYAMEQVGLYGGPVRSPLLPLSEAGTNAIHSLIAAEQSQGYFKPLAEGE
jgi:4-hydroxy-2-oxoglutarate aldolase